MKWMLYTVKQNFRDPWWNLTIDFFYFWDILFNIIPPDIFKFNNKHIKQEYCVAFYCKNVIQYELVYKFTKNLYITMSTKSTKCQMMGNT